MHPSLQVWTRKTYSIYGKIHLLLEGLRVFRTISARHFQSMNAKCSTWSLNLCSLSSIPRSWEYIPMTNSLFISHKRVCYSQRDKILGKSQEKICLEYRENLGSLARSSKYQWDRTMPYSWQNLTEYLHWAQIFTVSLVSIRTLEWPITFTLLPGKSSTLHSNLLR